MFRCVLYRAGVDLTDRLAGCSLLWGFSGGRADLGLRSRSSSVQDKCPPFTLRHHHPPSESAKSCTTA